MNSASRLVRTPQRISVYPAILASCNATLHTTRTSSEVQEGFRLFDELNVELEQLMVEVVESEEKITKIEKIFSCVRLF